MSSHDMLSTREVAELLGSSIGYIEVLVSRGHLATRITDTTQVRLIDRADVVRFKDQQTQSSDQVAYLLNEFLDAGVEY